MRRITRILGLAALVAAACLAVSLPGSTAHAQEGRAGRLTTGGMDLHLYRPAVDSKGLLFTNGTDILGHLAFSFGLNVDGGFGLLPVQGFVNDSGSRAICADPTAAIDPMQCPGGRLFRGRGLDYLFTGTLQFNLGLFNFMVLGAQLPVAFAAGPNLTLPGVFNDPQSGNGAGANFQGLGNLTIHSKFRLLRRERNGGLGIAALLQLELPTGDSSAFVGDNTFALWPTLALEWVPDRLVRLGFNLGSRIMVGQTPTIPVDARFTPVAMSSTMPMRVAGTGTDVAYGPMLTYSLGAGIRLGDSPVELTADLYGASIFSAMGQAGGHSLEAMGGLKIFVDRNSYLVLAGGGGIPIGGLLQSDARGTVGFVFEPSIGDRDGDGFRDDDDQCVSEPEDFDLFGDEDGCPEPDNDRDGILDIDDECPNVPEDRDGDADEDGCPEGNEGDRDGDGILDNDDRCPDDPEDRDGFQDEDGCPDPDNDADRILDHDDTCPNDPETYNGTEDEDGCPDRGSVVIEENAIVILDKIYFETDSAEIQSRSFPIIEAVAATLVGNPQITLLEIQGHADERSADDYNIRLTSDRAAAVLEALVQRGVARDRLRSAGYGERCPIDPRHVEQAWEQNRRVEFKIIRTSDGPTGVEIACPAGRELIPR